jgi:hypothetical protein
VSPVKYELGFYIPEDDIFHSHRHKNLRSYTFGIISQSPGQTIACRSRITGERAAQ